jgi:hypothetical protein
MTTAIFLWLCFPEIEPQSITTIDRSLGLTFLLLIFTHPTSQSLFQRTVDKTDPAPDLTSLQFYEQRGNNRSV